MRSRSSGREAAEGRLKPAEYRRSQQTGVDPARVGLAERVERCVKAAEGMGRDVVEEALDRAGVSHRANVASTGRVNGYRFSMTTDAQGEPVWFKASQLDRSLSWNRVAARIETVEPVRVQPVEAEPKRLLESKATHAQRVEAARHATEAAQREAVQAKREQRLERAASPRDLRKQIGSISAAKQRAATYQARLAARREWLSMIGRFRELREPETGWKNLRQIDKATTQRGRANAQQRRGAGAQVRRCATAHPLAAWATTSHANAASRPRTSVEV